jgi:hypothetical protein
MGFDARAASLEPNERWDADRRTTYLLRTDVERPLSIDHVVWPAVVPRGPNPYGLWSDKDELERNVQAASGRISLVAFTLVTQAIAEHELALHKPFLSMLEVPAPPAVSSGSCLGYDVADLAFLSGLSNCGYAPDIVETMRERWVPRLNKSHLFTNPADAAMFRSTTDVRVPEHAPFFVYGIYRVT